MKISAILTNVISQLLCQSTSFDASGNLTLKAKIDSQYKDTITFLLHLGIGKLQYPYNKVSTEISSDNPFSYTMKGDNDTITLSINANILKEKDNFFKELISALNKLIKDICECWIQVESEKYENSKIWGTYYGFLFTNLALDLGINTSTSHPVEPSAWLPTSEWNIADRIYLKGKKESVEKFISLMATELPLSLSEQKEIDVNTTRIIINSSKDATLNISNMHFSNDVVIKVTNQPRGTTFIQEMSAKSSRVSSTETASTKPSSTPSP